MMAMSHIVHELMRDRRPDHIKKVPREAYEQWARGFIFEGLRDQRYGQSFCNRFKIQDNILFYTGTVEEADQYILENYIE